MTPPPTDAELVARLQKREHYFRNASGGEYDANLLMKARFEIEQLSAEVVRLKAGQFRFGK